MTRIFALILTVLCLTMLIAGAGIVGAAVRERKKSMADYDRLSARIEEYRGIRKELDGSPSYEEANLALQAEQQEHDEAASQHRMDLAVYTATRGGLQAGETALVQAEAAFQQGKAQYLTGLAMFEEQEKAFWEGYEQFQEGKRQLEEGRRILDMAESALQQLRGQLAQSRSLAAILESDDENARQELTVAAYDSMLQSLDGAMQMYDTLKDQGGISPEQMQMVAQMLSEESGVDLSEVLGNMAWQGISTEDLEAMEAQVQAATGMSMGEIRAQIQAERDAAAQMDGDGAITEEQFAALQQAYAQSRDLISQMDYAMEGTLAQYEAELQESRAQLDAAQEQIDTLEPVLEQGKLAIEQARAALNAAGAQIQMGEASLAEGRRELEEQKASLSEKEEELRLEKEDLDLQAQELTGKSLSVSNLKDLERRETSVRLMLLERDDIQDRVDQGMELLPAADDYAASLLAQIQKTFRGMLWIGILMIVGCVAGFACVPASFERSKSRFWLIAPVLACLGCAAAAETLCRLQGRGDSYSSLAVAVFALIQLALVIPKKNNA